MNLTRIKRPDGVAQLILFLNGDRADELNRMELRQLLTYIVALEDANMELQSGRDAPEDKNSKAFRAVCSRHWCKRVHYGATKQEAHTKAEQCSHIPEAWQQP